MKTLLTIFALTLSASAQQPSPQPSISVGTDAVSASLCDRLTVGNVYVRSENAANGPINVQRCTQTGALAYAWQPISHLVAATLPARCAVGDIAYKTGVTAGQNLYGCTATDTWTAQAGAAGIGDVLGGSNLTSAGLIPIVASAATLTQDSALAFNTTTKSLGVIGSIVSGQTSTGTGAILLNGLTSGTVTVTTADAAGTWTLKVPATAGTNLQFLQTNGSGVTTWAGLVASQIPAVPLTAGATASPTGTNNFVVCTTTCTVTVPVPAAGAQLCVRNGMNVSTVITLSAIGSGAMYENTAGTAYGTAGTGTMVSGGAAGDRICIVGLDATHYLTQSFSGTWTAN